MRIIKPVAAALAAACCTLAVPTAIHAQAAARPADSPEIRREIAEAARRGELMYRYDQAAWHATDRMMPGLTEEVRPLMRGYIVVPGSAGQLNTVFYGEVDGALVELARYVVRGTEVVSGGWLPAGSRPRLSADALRLVAARQSAATEAGKQQLTRCGEGSLNALVLPPVESGKVSVYLMTPATTNDSYPLGGHHKFEVDEAGTVIASREFSKSCMMVPRNPAPSQGRTPAGMVVSHILDDHPTEIHAFASRNVGIPLYVLTPSNQSLWKVERGAIDFMQKVEAPPAAN